jgi:hypothetical protein
MQSPDCLVSRLRTMFVAEHGPRLSVLRQPKGPDGTKGFKKTNRPAPATNSVTSASNGEVANGGDSAKIHQNPESLELGQEAGKISVTLS